jgi:L-gulonate 3-dehydrogenase
VTERAGVRTAIVGSGTIGVGWAIVFARAGHRVAIHDSDGRRLSVARRELSARLGELAAAGLLDEAADAIAARVSAHGDLAQAVAGAAHVQECISEDLAAKRALFAALEQAAPADATLASSSSAITASAIAAELATRERCLVVHPANPPHLVPVAELVPAPFTAPEVVDATEALLRTAGMSPVRVRREIEGFVFNRLQGALLREAYCLVRDGVASVDDVDRVVREGLGRRWAIVGPFETADLNTRGGIAVHAQRMGPAYARMGAERGQHDTWTPDLVARVAAERRRILALEDWERRVAWRDARLIAQEQARRADEGERFS